MMRWLVGISAVLTTGLVSQVALADRLIIKQPGQHPDYLFEAEPHVLLEPFDEVLPGGGFRGTFEIVDNGFVRSINNTVGIGFGADFTKNTIRLPIVMQWNFWISENWSVFGEPGAAIVVRGDNKDAIDHFAFYAGGRWHFHERITLTMRVGKPAFSVGVSFLL